MGDGGKLTCLTQPSKGGRKTTNTGRCESRLEARRGPPHTISDFSAEIPGHRDGTVFEAYPRKRIRFRVSYPRLWTRVGGDTLRAAVLRLPSPWRGMCSGDVLQLRWCGMLHGRSRDRGRSGSLMSYRARARGLVPASRRDELLTAILVPI